jgi:hypothetical protein
VAILRQLTAKVGCEWGTGTGFAKWSSNEHTVKARDINRSIGLARVTHGVRRSGPTGTPPEETRLALQFRKFDEADRTRDRMCSSRSAH